MRKKEKRERKKRLRVGIYVPLCGMSLPFWKSGCCLTPSRHLLNIAECRCAEATMNKIRQLLPKAASQYRHIIEDTQVLFSASPGYINPLPPLPTRPILYQNHLGVPASPPLDLEISKAHFLGHSCRHDGVNPGGGEKRQEVLQSVKGGDNSKDFLEVGPDLGLKVEWAGRGMHGNKDGESTKHGIGSFLPCVEHAWS